MRIRFGMLLVFLQVQICKASFASLSPVQSSSNLVGVTADGTVEQPCQLRLEQKEIAKQRCRPSVLKLRGGSDPDLTMKKLFQAVRDADLDEIAKCAAQGADVNKFCNFIESQLEPNALHYACFQDDPNVVDKLVELGAKINVKSKRGYTALHYAALMGKLEICQKLVDLGADLGATDMYSDQPIDRAEQADCAAVVNWMAEQMAARGIARLWKGYHEPALELRELIEDASQLTKNHTFIPRFMTGNNGELLPEYRELKNQEGK